MEKMADLAYAFLKGQVDKKPLHFHSEIWFALSRSHPDRFKVTSSRKTPWDTLRSQMGKDNTRFYMKGSGRYGLVEWEDQSDLLSSVNAQNAEESTPLIDQAYNGRFLEDHLHTFIYQNIGKKGPLGRLQVYADERSRSLGKLYTVEVGEIDMLCIDLDSPTGDFVVLELKRRSSDETVGQISRYMGWVQEKLCTPPQTVRGIIMAQEGDRHLEYALKVNPRITVKYINIKFDVSDQPSS